MVREEAVAFATDRIFSPQGIYEIGLKLIGNEDREHLLVFCLNVKSKITCINTVSIGSLNCTLMHPREVFKPAILSNAHAVILVHNHPSGNPDPSRDDIQITKQLVEAGKILGIEVLDHVIVGDGIYASFKEQRLI